MTTKTTQVTIRFEPELIELADAIAEQIACTMPAMGPSRAAVLRSAVLRGLSVMATELGVPQKPKRSKR